MRTGAMVLGIIGGVIAFLMGLLGYGLGELADSTGFKLISLLIPIVGLIGAGIVKSKPKVGGILMLASMIGIFIVLKINILSLLAGIPLLIAGILGFAGTNEKV